MKAGLIYENKGRRIGDAIKLCRPDNDSHTFLIFQNRTNCFLSKADNSAFYFCISELSFGIFMFQSISYKMGDLLGFSDFELPNAYGGSAIYNTNPDSIFYGGFYTVRIVSGVYDLQQLNAVFWGNNILQDSDSFEISIVEKKIAEIIKLIFKKTL